MAAIIKENSPVLPGEHDIFLARQSSQKLAALLPKKKKDFPIQIGAGRNEAQIILPFSAVNLLLEILTQMAEGNAVTLIPIHAELTTQEAANILNVSRPFLIKLMEKGELPFHKVGTHRRILFADLIEFKSKRDLISKNALDELAKQAQELGLGY